MAYKGALTSLAKAAAATISIVAAIVLTGAAVTALSGLSKELTTVVIVAGLVVAAGLAAVATVES